MMQPLHTCSSKVDYLLEIYKFDNYRMSHTQSCVIEYNHLMILKIAADLKVAEENSYLFSFTAKIVRTTRFEIKPLYD